jgi:hypothetical protein
MNDNSRKFPTISWQTTNQLQHMNSNRAILGKSHKSNENLFGVGVSFGAKLTKSGFKGAKPN